MLEGCVGRVDGADRDVVDVRLPRWGGVVEAEGVVPWLVVDPVGRPVEPVRLFLREFVARGNRPASVRSYAYALLRWWLLVVEVDWDRATTPRFGISCCGWGCAASRGTPGSNCVGLDGWNGQSADGEGVPG
jgi:hypothetical protein